MVNLVVSFWIWALPTKGLDNGRKVSKENEIGKKDQTDKSYFTESSTDKRKERLTSRVFCRRWILRRCTCRRVISPSNRLVKAPILCPLTSLCWSSDEHRMIIRWSADEHRGFKNLSMFTFPWLILNAFSTIFFFKSSQRGFWLEASRGANCLGWSSRGEVEGPVSLQLTLFWKNSLQEKRTQHILKPDTYICQFSQKRNNFGQ